MEAKAKDDFPYRDCKIAIQVRKVMGDGIFSEAYEFDRVVAIQEKETKSDRGYTETEEIEGQRGDRERQTDRYLDI